MLISLKDNAKGEFTAPMLVSSEEDAKRSFILCFMNGQNSMVAQFPSQFDLYEVGDFDLSTGIMRPINPRFIINGLTAKMEAIRTVESNQLCVEDSTPEVASC